VGLIVPNKSSLKEELKQQSIDPSSEEGVQTALTIIKTEIGKYFKDGEFGSLIPERWLPAAVALLEDPFTEENGMINSTLKMVRNKVVEHYKDKLDYLYSPDGKNIDNPRNRSALKHILS
jgi:long-chain acyl-CoA synthetase